MAKSRYQHSISLPEEEEMLIEELKKQGIGIQKIFNKGLEQYFPQVPKELLKKVRDRIFKL